MGDCTKLYVRNIKRGFATNSSSYHSTIILTEEEFDKWKLDELEVDGIYYSFIDNEEHFIETGDYYYL